MYNIELLRLQLNHLVTQARQDIYMLSTLNDQAMKQQILQRLWDGISSIHFLSELLANQVKSNQPYLAAQAPISVPSSTHNSPIPLPVGNNQSLPSNNHIQPAITPLPNQSPPQSNQRIFTLEELATYNGKNGSPAYVAVNGIVYDVTNNRAWAAATHFALTAGKDYTKEFASCHAGQQSILATLPIVGRLAS
ncbi:cytochrome b5 domain-containing protein [Neobacillus sp. D3-1R]|uniref:cytochrome b5 domain-containing protein n=1 Tax=Neobacillus sp. D3-1R TaxID=3445778 RepID=UPI003FA088C3